MKPVPEYLILEDDRVLMRPLQPEDLEYLYPFVDQEPDIWKYSAVSVVGREGMKRYVETALEARKSAKEYPFIIFDKKSGACAGSSRFYDINLDFATTQLGYTWYGQQFQQTGLNRHCKLLMLRFAFADWGMERVEFRADARNERSINAMKKIGCSVEGILRNNMPIPAGRRNSIILSILKDEWFDHVEKNLLDKMRD